jgi:hypothetical protein
LSITTETRDDISIAIAVCSAVFIVAVGIIAYWDATIRVLF